MNRSDVMKTRLTIASLLCTALFAQTNRGGITGTVTDPSGASVGGATVAVIDVGTARTVRLTTSAEGSYTAESLEPTTYRVVVSATGFKTTVVDDVKVDSGSVPTVNVALKIGSTQDKIT